MLSSRRSDIFTIQRSQYKNWCNSNNGNFAASNIVTPTSIMPVSSAAAFSMDATTPDTSADNNSRSFPLPPELLLEVLSYLSDSQPSLHSASLVCKQWLYCAAPILYCSPQIIDTYRWATFILTLTRERMSFFYGDLIRSIDLSSGKSIESMKDQEFYRRLSNSTEDARIATHNTVTTNSTMPATNDTPNQERRHHIRLNLRNAHREAAIVFNENNTRTTANNINNNDNTHAAAVAIENNESHSTHHQQEQHEYLMKGLPYIIVSTSSLVQVAHTCKNITSLNLSYTSLLYDSVVAETGEYLSTLQKYAVQPGLTHLQVSIKQAIKSIGEECTQLQEVKLQRCEWVTAHIIWMFAYYCPSLKRLDARRSTKCTVKRLIADVLENTSAIVLDTITPIAPISTLTDNHHLLQAPAAADRSDVVSGSSSGNDSSIVLPSSSSSSTLDNNSLSIRSNVHDHHGTNEDDEEDDDEEEHIQTRTFNRAAVNFRLNERTGAFEQVESNTSTHARDTRATTTNSNQHRHHNQLNDAFWFVPTATTILEQATHPLGRRPPSPLHPLITLHAEQAGNSVGNTNKPLKKIIHDILTDAKELGAIDLNWLQEY